MLNYHSGCQTLFIIQFSGLFVNPYKPGANFLDMQTVQSQMKGCIIQDKGCKFRMVLVVNFFVFLKLDIFFCYYD